jgi:hypothetical protein
MSEHVLREAPAFRCQRHNVQMAQATGETSTCFAVTDLKVTTPQCPEVEPWPVCRGHVEEVLTAAVLLFGHAELVQVTPVMIKRFRFESITLAALKDSEAGG